MSDEPPKLRAVTTARDEMAGAFDGLKRIWGAQRENADEIAKTRKTMFDAYVAAGFTDQQALELCRSLTI